MADKKAHSSKQEHAVAEFLGWSVVPGSGARPTYQGDLINESWLGECKTHVTADRKITFNRAVWHKICEEAAAKFRQPVLIVDDGSQSVSKTWCLFSFNPAVSREFATRCGFVFEDVPAQHVRTHINFTSQELQAVSDPKSTVYLASFDGTCGIATLETFCQLIEDGVL